MSSPGIEPSQRLAPGVTSVAETSAGNEIANRPARAALTNAESVPQTSQGSAATTQVSPQAQLLGKLEKLQKTDSVKFKQVLTGVATQLQAAAQAAAGTEKQALTEIAGKFTQAANGDLSALQSNQPSGKVAAAYLKNAPETSSPLTAATQKGGRRRRGGGKFGSQTAVAAAFQSLSAALDNSTTARVTTTKTALNA